MGDFKLKQTEHRVKLIKMNVEDKAHFVEHGYVIIKNVISQEDVKTIKKGIDKLVTDFAQTLLDQRCITHLYEDEPFETRLIKLAKGNENVLPTMFREELHIPQFYHLFCNEAVLEMIVSLLPKADQIRVFPNYSIRPKLPAYEPHDITWHQDAGLNYYVYIIFTYVHNCKRWTLGC